MAVSSNQMTIWTSLYDPATAQNAHLKVRSEIQEHLRPEVRKDIHDFLQGSYRNKTSIYQDSDVDLVLKYNGICEYDFSALDWNSQIRATAQLPKNLTGYGFHHFRQEIARALVDGFGGSDVDLTHKKSIKVKGISGERFHADVIPCIQYRRYTEWNGNLESGFVPGIVFWTTDTNARIVNFPELHISNGALKNNLTNDAFKPTVRLYKNMRNIAVNKGLLNSGIAPSYFVECLLWNVDAGQFSSQAGTSFFQTYSWLEASLNANFMCQNGQVPLFDPAGRAPEQWSIQHARSLLSALYTLYLLGV